MHEALHVWRIRSEYALVIPFLPQIDFFHAIESFEEGSPELVAAVLAVGDAVYAAFLLEFDHFPDSLFLNRGERLWTCIPTCDGIPMFDELLRAKQGAYMFYGSISAG